LNVYSEGMMKNTVQLRQISDVMTRMPKVITADATLGDALDLMSEQNIRHLPVLYENRVVGILSERNAKALALLKDGNSYLVGDAMTPEPYVVLPTKDVRKTVGEMLQYKYGSAVVQEKDGKVVGIFTTIDALRLLKQLLATPGKKKAPFPHFVHKEVEIRKEL
jgi:acetoin utilization protein AcuB